MHLSALFAVFSSALYCTVAGIDKLLAQHIAHLFIRDPLSLFQEKIHLDDENESDHFEVKLTSDFYCSSKLKIARQQQMSILDQCTLCGLKNFS